MSKYKWQGEPVKTVFGHSYVDMNEEKPLFWYNFECQGATRGACLPTVQITTKGGEVFYIANHYGIGAHKLSKGGWPNMPHFSISKDCKFEPDRTPPFGMRKLDLEGYEAHEKERDNWRRLAHPEDYKRIEALREAARRIESKIGSI